MDRAAERITDWLGSTPVVLSFTFWLIFHNARGFEYVSFISDMAILIGLLILRAETVQSRRTEHTVKADLKKSDEVIRLLRRKR